MGIFDNTPIKKLLDNMRSLSMEDLFIEVISKSEVKKYIVKLNTDQMRLEFMNSEGILLSSIGGPYADSTVRDGGKQGKFKVDLYDTGDFHKSFRVENITGRGFEIKSDPIKDDGTNLLEEWGEEVEGLTIESMDKLSLFLVNYYQDAIRKKLLSD